MPSGLENKWGELQQLQTKKGGVGKTTTAINLSACLAEAKQRVLVIDIDPQGNTTSGLGIDKEEKENTIYEVMLGEISIEQANCKEAFDCLDVIPSNVNLAGAEIDLIDIEDREYILKKSIAQIRKNYDYIILDCPPSLSMLTVNAMTAADTVLVPISANTMHWKDNTADTYNSSGSEKIKSKSGTGGCCLYNV